MIRFTPLPSSIGGTLTDVSAFPGETFVVNPESIGDASNVCLAGDLDLEWSDLGGGVWVCTGHCSGELSYTLTVTPDQDHADLEILLTNESGHAWAHSLAFNHLGCWLAQPVVDHECVRHWCRTGGEFKRLIEVPRKFSKRPTVQVYNVQGAPPVAAIPFAAGFQATPNVALEGWLAIESRDTDRIVAVVSKPALFLFQNMELSCIHSGMSFGALGPGETGQARLRVYLVQASLADWYRRMRAEFPAL